MLFWPFARRLCPLFSSSCLSGFSRLRPGVCVCVYTVIAIGLILMNRSCFDEAGGARGLSEAGTKEDLHSFL